MQASRISSPPPGHVGRFCSSRCGGCSHSALWTNEVECWSAADVGTTIKGSNTTRVDAIAIKNDVASVDIDNSNVFGVGTPYSLLLMAQNRKSHSTLPKICTTVTAASLRADLLKDTTLECEREYSTEMSLVHFVQERLARFLFISSKLSCTSSAVMRSSPVIR